MAPTRLTDDRLTPASLPAALAILLFLSGFSALVYQILWLRLLSLVFGVTVHAASAVLASFMAGLALGSLAAGRLADRVRNPLRWFAAAEAGVALSALATPQLLSASERLYTDLYPALAESPRLLTAARFLCSFAVLVIPTVLMGATLPLVVRSSLARVERLGERVSLLYASNTGGAIAGTLLAGFYMIGELGISATFRIAAAVNLLVCLIAGAVSFVVRRPAAVDARRRSLGLDLAPDAPPEPDDPDRVRTLVLAAFAISGAASLALEIIWFRVLVLFVPATIYAFSTMLATFLTGIAAGSALITPLMRRRRNWSRVLAIVQLATALAILLSLRLLSETYQAGWRTSGTVQASAVAVFPATLLMGIAFPIGIRLYAGAGAEASRHVAKRLGVLYSVNVCGAIVGAIAAAFVLLPVLGSRMSLLVVAFMYVVAGLMLLAGAPRLRLRVTVGTAVAGVAAFAAAAINLPDPFDVVQARRYRGERLVWREEGVQTTVSVHVGPKDRRVLYLDGLHQANSSAEMTRVHAEIGHLPMALHVDPKDALVVGLGGGITAGAVSTHEAAVDVVELSQAVVRGSDWFRDVNHDVLRRPNVRLRVDDGRNYLMLTSKQYDVVTADLIQPIHAGAGNLYSVEYFRLARAVLKREGLMLQWIGHRSDAQYKLIMRTFLDVFPHTTLWANGSLMVGATEPLRIDREGFERKLRRPGTRAALAAAGLGGFDALLARYTAGPEELRRLVGAGPVLSDDRPMTEYHRSIRDDGLPIDLSGVGGDVQRHLAR
jgi:spermidine synthase